MAASIPQIQSALKVFVQAILMLVLFPNISTFRHLERTYLLSLCYDFVLHSYNMTLTKNNHTDINKCGEECSEYIFKLVLYDFEFFLKKQFICIFTSPAF
jgi:hypothetical protein